MRNKKIRLDYKGVGKEAESVTSADERADGNGFVKYYGVLVGRQ